MNWLYWKGELTVGLIAPDGRILAVKSLGDQWEMNNGDTVELNFN
jgi:hypothetical protein